MANKNHIGFSHDYTKLHGQTSGTLVAARLFNVVLGTTVTQETLQYDTDGVFPLPDGRYIQLVFIGNKQIPFTTYRTDTPEHRHRFFGHDFDTFTFNFKHGD